MLSTMNVFVFKIQTVPDIDSCRRLYDLHGLADDDVAKAVFHKRRQQTNTEVLPHHLQKIVSISAVLRNRDQFRVWSLGDVESDEEELLRRFFSGIERYSPHLVSWTGSQLDLPIIHYRSLLYLLNAEQYWKLDDKGSVNQKDDYSVRYDRRHTDLSQVLSGYLPVVEIPLDEVAGLCGCPENDGISSIGVWDNFLEGNMQLVRNGGETDVLNTYLIYLRLLCNKGQLDSESYQQECKLVRNELKSSSAEHLQAFNNAWVEF